MSKDNLTQEQLEPFNDVLTELANWGIVCVKAFYIKDDNYDSVVQFVCQDFGPHITKDTLHAICHKHSDPEFATFEYSRIRNIITLVAFVH